MPEVNIIVIGATAVIVLTILYFSWIFIRGRNIKKLHDRVVDETTRDILEACLAYGQTRLSAGQYEKFKNLLTDQIANGQGGLSLARLVENCIDEAQEDEE